MARPTIKDLQDQLDAITRERDAAIRDAKLEGRNATTLEKALAKEKRRVELLTGIGEHFMGIITSMVRLDDLDSADDD